MVDASFGEGRKGIGMEVLRYKFFPDRYKTIPYQHA